MSVEGSDGQPRLCWLVRTPAYRTAGHGSLPLYRGGQFAITVRMKTSDEPCLAATVALLRDHADGPQVFMLKRQRGNAFTEGAYVFVGGRVDRQDQDARLHAFCEGFAAHDAARVLGLNPCCSGA